MNLINYATLASSTADMFMTGKIKSQKDIVEVAKVWMSDLGVDFRTALVLIHNLVSKLAAIN